MHVFGNRIPGSFAALAFALVALPATGCGVNTSQNGSVQITSISPPSGSITGGVTVTLAGRGFDDGSGSATVVFGTVPAEVLAVTDTSIDARIPSGLTCGAVDVQVTNGNGAAFKEGAFSYEGGTGTLTVTSIDPTSGELAGNTQVTITGSGFSGGVGVAIGGVPLRNISIVSDTEITAITPPAVEGGAGDLLLRNCGSQASIPSGFIYATGLNGGLVEMSLTDYVNPTQFGGTPPVDYIDPYVIMVEPNAAPVLNPLPTINTCTLNYAPAPSGGDPFYFVDAGAQVHLRSGTKQVDLDVQPFQLDDGNGGTVTFYEYYYPLSDTTANDVSRYVDGAAYDFGIDGSATLGAFEVLGAFRVPESFPSPGGTVNMFAEPKETHARNTGLNVTWQAPTLPGSVMQMYMVGYNNAGSSDINGDGTNNDPDEVLYCLAEDDGNFTIPAASLQAFDPTVTQIIVRIRRRTSSTFLSPANGTTITALGYHQKVGYFYLN